MLDSLEAELLLVLDHAERALEITQKAIKRVEEAG